MYKVDADVTSFVTDVVAAVVIARAEKERPSDTDKTVGVAAPT